MNTRVNFEIAKLLKEKRFDYIDCGGYYHVCDGYTEGYAHCYSPSNTQADDAILAPTIAQIIMWLYEKHGIWIGVSITIQKEYYYQCIDITGKKDPTKNNYPSRICKPGNYYNSPNEAYEVAIEYVLKNLI